MKQILCFGDSNTYGLIPGTKDRYDWDTRWSGRIGQRLWEDGCRIVEEGLCGRTTVFDDPLRDGRRGTELLSVILETHKPVDVVVLMPVSYTHLRAHETGRNLVCRLLLEKKKTR